MCRLRAVLSRVVVLPLVQGISGSLLGIVPHRALSGTVLLGGLMVMKMFGQWLGVDKVASCQTWPRKSPLGQCPPPLWLLSDLATMTSDIRSVFDVPSVICDHLGLVRGELVAAGVGGGGAAEDAAAGADHRRPPNVRLP